MTIAQAQPRSQPGKFRAYGIPVTVFPASAQYRLDVWRAPDNGSGAPNDGAAIQCQVVGAGPLSGTTFFDLLPNDGATRYYKYRHVDDTGTVVSSFTAYSLGAVPSRLTDYQAVAPVGVFSALMDNFPPSTLYELRLAGALPDPDTVDGLQTYIDFPATTNFMRVGQTPKAIVSSTNASPISVQVTAHGYMTGDVVAIRGHLVNTNADVGVWTITVVDANNFTLNGSTGNGVGGATGHVLRLSLTVDANGNLTSYGALQTRVLKVFDNNNAVIMDIETGKRIFAIPVQPSVNSGTALSIDLSTGLTQQVLLTGTCTITLNNPTDGGRFRIWFQQDTTGSRPFPTIVDGNGNAIVMYVNDTPPTLTTTPGAMDLFEFEYRVNPTKRYTCITLQTNVLLPVPNFKSVTASNFNTAVTAHAVSMPATVNAGDLLIVLFSNNTGTITTPSGWTSLGSVANANVILTAYAIVALGTEGGTTVGFTTSVGTQAAASVYRITRWSQLVTSSGIALQSTSSAGTATPAPPSLTPSWTTDRTMWMAVAAEANQPTVSAYPANYTTGQQNTLSGAASGVSLGSAIRAALYASTETPGTFTFSTSNAAAIMTIAIRPPL